jgi:hypothetical protein
MRTRSEDVAAALDVVSPLAILASLTGRLTVQLIHVDSTRSYRRLFTARLRVRHRRSATPLPRSERQLTSFQTSRHSGRNTTSAASSRAPYLK